MTWIDSHCHLDFADFAEERDAVIARARAAGVTRMVTICTKLHQEPAVRAIAETYEGVFYAAGTHPMSAAAEPMATVDQIVTLSRHLKFVGIGETGLDYHYTADSAEVQKTSLRVHIEAAQETGLPLIIHARAADDDIAVILAEGMRAKPYACVMHCFSSGADLARAALEMGFYLSMSGITAFPKSHDLRAIFKSAPLDRILLETDSPYLAPVPYRGKLNNPSYVPFVAKLLGELRGCSSESIGDLTTKNFLELFSKTEG